MTNELGRYLRRVRLARKLTLKQVGQAVGRTPQNIWDIENGKRGKVLNPLLAVSLAEYLQIPVSSLFNLANIPTDINSKKYVQFLKMTRNKGRAARIQHAFDGLHATLTELTLESAGIPGAMAKCQKMKSFLDELDSSLSAG